VKNGDRRLLHTPPMQLSGLLLGSKGTNLCFDVTRYVNDGNELYAFIPVKRAQQSDVMV
jgi:hypothetical protein